MGFTCRHIIEVLIVKGLDITISCSDTLLWWFMVSVGFSLGQYLPHLHWAPPPAPLGFVSGSMGMLMAFLLIMYQLYKKVVSSRIPLELKHHAYRKTLWFCVYIVFIFMATTVGTPLLIATLSTEVSRKSGMQYVMPFVLFFWRSGLVAVGKCIVVKIQYDIKFLLKHTVWLIVTAYQMMILTSAEDVYVAIICGCIDLLEASTVISAVRDARRAQQSLHTPSVTIDHLCREAAEEAVVIELIELVVSTQCAMGWLILRLSPNSHAFAGVGVSAFGVIAPESIPDFLAKVSVWLSIELLTMCLMHIYLRRIVDLSACRSGLLRRYGSLMALIGIISPGFQWCFLKITCGFDFQLRFSWLQTPH